jgi:hypothetical protein
VSKQEIKLLVLKILILIVCISIFVIIIRLGNNISQDMIDLGNAVEEEAVE